MAVFTINRQIPGTFGEDHNAGIAEVIALFAEVYLVFWDNTGFIHRSKVKKGILSPEDARIRLFVIGRITADATGSSAVATIDIRFDLPVDTYRSYSQVPITTWGTVRSNLVTYLGGQSITAVDGVVK